MLDKILKLIIVMALIWINVVAGAIIYAGLFVFPIYIGVMTLNVIAGVVMDKYLK